MDKVIQAKAVLDNGDGTLRVEVDGAPFVLDLRRAKWSAPPAVLDMDSPAGRLVKAVREKRAAVLEPRERIDEQIREAGKTLRADKMPAEVMALGKMSCALPEYVRTQEERIEAQRDRDARKGEEGRTRTPPTAAQIDRLGQVLDWLLWVQRDLGEDHRLVLAGKMYGYGYRRIADGHPNLKNKDAVARAWSQVVDLIIKRMAG